MEQRQLGRGARAHFLCLCLVGVRLQRPCLEPLCSTDPQRTGAAFFLYETLIMADSGRLDTFLMRSFSCFTCTRPAKFCALCDRHHDRAHQ